MIVYRRTFSGVLAAAEKMGPNPLCTGINRLLTAEVIVFFQFLTNSNNFD